MSEPIDLELPETEALAAEHALGVLDSGARAAAELRMAREPGFAALVETWQSRLAPMLGRLASVPPPEGLWLRIERGLPVNDNLAGLRLWRGLAAGAMSLAAASLVGVVVLANRPPPVAATPHAL